VKAREDVLSRSHDDVWWRYVYLDARGSVCGGLCIVVVCDPLRVYAMDSFLGPHARKGNTLHVCRFLTL